MTDLDKNITAEEATIAAEEAKRKELEGKDWSKADFESNPKNYLVEAGAGAGKTFIMVQRILNQLVSGVYEPEDIVAITFTNKSTLELRERLDSKLADRREELLKKNALTEAEQQTLTRLEYLIQESGRMQVSTIHSFCHTMLAAMPFSSPLGLDMQMIEDEALLAEEILQRKVNKKRFRKARDMGYPHWTLPKAFFDRCNNNEVDIVYERNMQKQEAAVCQAAVALHNALTHTSAITSSLSDELQEIIAMPAQTLEADLALVKQLGWLCLTEEKIPLNKSLTQYRKTAFRKTKDGKELNDIWEGPAGKALCKAAGELLHSYIMADMDAMLTQHRDEKKKRHWATSNDLLLRTRDMLRDKPEARAYFHQRYKVLYVDEMQDTDPVQAEILFYLTAQADSFDPTNWQNCKPKPGSLFLVGDPKQAIYRFRGADIDVYNTLLELFSGEDGSVGEKVTLRFNFRSSKEICAFSDEVFTPPICPAHPSDIKEHHFVGGKYHAEYVPMIARNGSCELSRVVKYRSSAPAADIDPMHVAAFIRTMIDEKMLVGINNPKFDKIPHPAEAKDFLILTYDKYSAAQYSEALNAMGIPVQVTGEKKFKEVKPIQLAMTHLRSLLSLRDDPLLICVLQDCYDIELDTIRVFQQRTGTHSITGVLKQWQLQKIRRALSAEESPSEELLDLCTALEEIASLRRAAKTQPAMAVIEQLLEGGYGVWQGLEGMSKSLRQQVYSEVQQYLNLVRKNRERSFPALVAYALECVEKPYSQELSLEPTENAVRIMNLHKAKGLEGEVVILAHSDYAEHTPTRQVVRNGNHAEEHVAFTYKKGKFSSPVAVAFPAGWEKTCEEEAKYLKAEYARLLYVAATRAKTMLVVYEDSPDEKKPSYWGPLLDHLEKADEKDPVYGKAFQALCEGKLPDDEDDKGDENDQDVTGSQDGKESASNQSGNADEDVKTHTDGKDNRDDKGVEDDKPDQDEADDKESEPFVFQAGAIEKKLCIDAAALAKNSIFHITPSKLGEHERGQNKPKDGEEPDISQIPAGAKNDQADGEEDAENAVKENTITFVVAEDVCGKHGPFGADWGTMVHRVAELVVREGSYRVTVLEEAARQAVKEGIESGLDQENLWRLGLRKTDDEAKIMDTLVPQIMLALVFLTSEITPLRQLMADGAVYPELPFILQAKKDLKSTAELYKHLSAHISDEKAKDRTLAVEGIIDLAIRKGDCWYVVDYKTDKLGKDESKEDFVERLRKAYTPQITAYARVLERMNGEKSLPVKGAWLCSVPLGGELIELDIAP